MPYQQRTKSKITNGIFSKNEKQTSKKESDEDFGQDLSDLDLVHSSTKDSFVNPQSNASSLNSINQVELREISRFEQIE